MRLLHLTVENFGVFRGIHQFDLSPSRTNGRAQNVVLVQGHNGAGKSTLFQAMALALHGSFVLGDRVSAQHYSDFLLSRLHRRPRGSHTVVSLNGHIALSFQYIRSGRPLRIQVDRHWERQGNRVSETLGVFQDGEPVAVNPADYQTWLNDLIPPGLSPLCFFDAERLDGLASPKRHDELLQESLRRLLGLDLVRRLQTDLMRHTFNQGSSKKAERLRREILQYQAAVDALEAQLTHLQEHAAALESQRLDLEAVLVRQERQLAAEGGAYAARRPMLQARYDEVQEEIEAVENHLREQSSGLLPFALAPGLCHQLSQRLNQEAEARRRQLAEDLWQARIGDVEAALHAADLWQTLNISDQDRQVLLARISQILQMTAAGDAESQHLLIHHLSEPDQDRVQSWIAQVLQSVPQQARAFGERLRALRAERERIEKDLQRAPDEATLAPIHVEITRLEQELLDLQQRQTRLDEQIAKVQFQHDEQSRRRERIADELSKAQALERHVALAERSRVVLRVYEDALARHRLGALEEALAKSFNTVCRKEHLLETVRINPDNFGIELRGTEGRTLMLSEFSAGERQLYALALLWALRQVSGRRLPLVIDTPLARLDAIHRQRLIHDYIPVVSDQVMLFVTDAELDTDLLAQLGPRVARTYGLNYDSQRGETMATCENQPKSRGLILYRGEAPSAGPIEINEVFGTGLGQTWTTDPDYAGAWGKVRQALLPPTARRLVLVDPETREYNWEQIEELERMTSSPFLVQTIRAGRTLEEVWQEEWTALLKEAGYDSIATVSIDGPEEYVLNPFKLIPVNGTTPNGKNQGDGV
ncbi:MAG: DNA sulfur modification protein DndD [Ardenticatenaceae bacterium]|nr:DNA sulfur modification protein DndD [Ardenticatenaceae bacterium]